MTYSLLWVIEPRTKDRIDTIYTNYSKLLLSYIRRLISAKGWKIPEADIDDILQEIFVVACKNPEKIRVDNEIGWLKKTAFNILMATGRKKHGKPEVAIEHTFELIDEDADIFCKLSIESLLSVLSSRDYELIYDHTIKGKSIAELSKELCVSANSLNIRITRIRKKLRETTKKLSD